MAPGIGGFHEHIKEGLDYIDIPIQHMALWLCVERVDALASCLGEELWDGKPGL